MLEIKESTHGYYGGLVGNQNKDGFTLVLLQGQSYLISVIQDSCFVLPYSNSVNLLARIHSPTYSGVPYPASLH